MSAATGVPGSAPAVGATCVGHAGHAATWLSWRDDCEACGYTRLDVDQCERGHPDDGVTWCGACGHDAQAPFGQRVG